MHYIPTPKKYYVAVSSDFDPEVYIYTFEAGVNAKDEEEAYDKAKAFLHWKWEDCYNHSFHEEINDISSYHSDEHAAIYYENEKQIDYYLLDNLDEYLLTCHFESVPNEFEEVWKGYV